MAYGILKCDTITFTDGGIDKSVTISGLVQNPTFSGNITVTGTISGNLVQGQTVSGDTVTGTTAAFTTGTFISLTGTTIQGTTATYTTGSFTSLTGTTTTGTTANFVSGVFTTQLSGATITGNAAAFTTVTGGTATITSGVFASGTAAAPSVSVGATNNGIYSPSANNVAISTSGTGRLFVDASGNVGLGTSSPTQLLDLESGTGARIAFTDTGTRRWSIGTPAGGSTGFSIYDESGSAEVLRITSAGNVGVGTTSPDGTLHVHTASAGTVSPWVNADDLTVESDGATGISIIAPDNNQANLIFGSPSDNIGSIIRWVHDDNELQVGTHKTDGFLTFKTAIGQERCRLDSSGRLLVGTSSARTNISGFAVGTGASNIQQESTTEVGSSLALLLSRNAAAEKPIITLGRGKTTTIGSNGIVASGDDLGAINFAGNDGANFIPAAQILGEVDGTPGINDMPGRLVFSTTADGASSPTERMRIDSSGRLLVGASSALGVSSSTAAVLEIETTGIPLSVVRNSADATGPILAFGKSRGTTPGSLTAVVDGDILGEIRFAGADGTNRSPFGGSIQCRVDGTPGTNDMPGRLVFSTTADGASSPTEHVRIDEAGSLFVGNGTTGTIGTQASATNLGIFSVDVSNGPVGAQLRVSRNIGAANAVAQFWGDSGQAIIKGDGDLENTNNRYTGISDIKFKQNIEDAPSQWDDIKEIQVRKYEFIAHPERKHIGVVAQELEQVCPGLVIERQDEDTKESYKSVAYSVLYMKAVKALQEAMERIESLEAKVAVLESA